MVALLAWWYDLARMSSAFCTAGGLGRRLWDIGGFVKRIEESEAAAIAD